MVNDPSPWLLFRVQELKSPSLLGVVVIMDPSPQPIDKNMTNKLASHSDSTSPFLGEVIGLHKLVSTIYANCQLATNATSNT